MHLNKWRLMLSTLPLVAAILVGKFILQFALGLQGFVDFSDVGIVLTAGVFLLGFLLAGTMADYKEAEKIPAELASTLETLEEIFVLAATNRPALDFASLRRGSTSAAALANAGAIIRHGPHQGAQKSTSNGICPCVR